MEVIKEGTIPAKHCRCKACGGEYLVSMKDVAYLFNTWVCPLCTLENRWISIEEEENTTRELYSNITHIQKNTLETKGICNKINKYIKHIKNKEAE